MFTVYSGETKGVDTEVEHLAVKYGHNCVVKVPPCHERARCGQLTPLNRATMEAATATVTQVAQYLGRTVSSPLTLIIII